MSESGEQPLLRGREVVTLALIRRGVDADGALMRLTGHELGMLREYMRDLVEQAGQEEQAHAAFGFAAPPYRPHQAISDLLAILDDRIESEGIQVGLPEDFLHRMWTLCNEAGATVAERVWLEQNMSVPQSGGSSRSHMRDLTYRALLAYVETNQPAAE